MREVYRGYEITVEREDCLGGWTNLYWSIFRDSDGFEACSSFEDSAETETGMLQILKGRVDEELKQDDPWLEKANN